MHEELEPVLALLLRMFPEAVQYESDRSLVVTDRHAIEAVLDSLKSPVVANVGDEAQLDAWLEQAGEDVVDAEIDEEPIRRRALPAPPSPVLEPITCRRCHEHEVLHESHLCLDCKQAEREAAIKARSIVEPAPRLPAPPTTLVRPRRPRPVEQAPVQAPAPTPRQVPAPVVKRTQPIVPARAQPPKHDEGELVYLGGWEEGMDLAVVPEGGWEIQQMMASGIPTSIKVSLHTNVMELWGLDLDLVGSVLRNPQRVELDTTFKERSYPVLRMVRGDVYVVVGFRNRQTPSVLGIYVADRDQQEGHIELNVGHGGGTRKRQGKPSNPKQLLARLYMMGCDIGEANDKGVAEVKFKGQDLGKAQIDGIRNRADVGSDYDRFYRKVEAIRRREASVGA